MSVDTAIVSGFAGPRAPRMKYPAVATRSQAQAYGRQQVRDESALASTLADLDSQSQSLERAVLATSIADGAMAQIGDLLAQAKEFVSANANSAGLSDDEKAANQMEIDSIVASVDRLA